jgi:hypothetical protein
MALIDYLATLPRNSKVLVNLQAPNEFEYEIGLHLVELKKRADIVVDYFRLQTPSAGSGPATHYVLNPLVRNEVHPSVRYAMDEAGTTLWNRAANDFMGSRRQATFGVRNRVRLADVGFHRLLCVGLGPRGPFCGVPRPFIDRRLLTYGWDVYRIDRRVEDVAQPAVFFPDGSWLLRFANGEVRRLRFGAPFDYPLSGEWERRGSSGIGVYRPADKTWRLDVDLDGSADIIFRWSEMEPDDVPIAGDWYGQGRASPGYFRPRDATWHFLHGFREEPDAPVLQFGTPSDIPLAGDWDGDGRTTIGIYRKASGVVTYLNAIVPEAVPVSFAGSRDATPVVGNWSGNGADSVTFVSNDLWSPRLVNSPEAPSNPAPPFHFDSERGRPLSGRWR